MHRQGVLLHRKKDKRDASSRSLSRWTEPGLMFGVMLNAEQELRAREDFVEGPAARRFRSRSAATAVEEREERPQVARL